MKTFGDFLTTLLSNWDCRAVQGTALCRSRRELSNAYFLAKFGLDTAKNEPCQVCPIPRNAAASRANFERTWKRRPPARRPWTPRGLRSRRASPCSTCTPGFSFRITQLDKARSPLYRNRCCKLIVTWKLSPKSPQHTRLHCSQNSFFKAKLLQNTVNSF